MAGLKNYLKQMKSMGKIQQTPDLRAGSGASAHPSTICQSLVRNGLNSNCCPYVWKRLGERYSSACPEACVKHGEALSRCGVGDPITLGLGMITVES